MVRKIIENDRANVFSETKYDLVADSETNVKADRLKKWYRSLWFRITLAAVKVSLFVYFCLFVVLPLIYKNSYSFQKAVVFLNFINIPPNADYEHPSKYDLQGSRNFYLTTDDGITLGIWQILPENLVKHSNNTEAGFFEDVISDGQNVVIYSHGNGGSRLTPHRVEIYKVLRKHFHVITYDYRSYGDSSSGDLSEQTIVNDCMFIYKWVANRTKGNIFVWGHSLGTSISTHALAVLQMQGTAKMPVGLILEAPFNNMRDEISEFPLAKVFKHLPWFEYTIVEPMQENNFKFETDKYICQVDMPIMVLHAVDDGVVPFKLGLKLYEAAKKCRRKDQGQVIFHKFTGPPKYGHKFLYKASDIHDKIRTFIEVATQEKAQHP